MYCRKCGTLNQDTATKCVQCGETLQPTSAPPGIAGAPQKIPNYLVHAILVTLLCCPPTGIAAIVYAAQVNSKIQTGDIQGALNSSQKAKMWFWISFGVGVVLNLITAIILILSFVAGAHQQGSPF